MKYNDLYVKIYAVVIQMEGNFVNKFINKFKNKLNNNKNSYPQKFEYVFNDEDVNQLAKQNNEKIKELKKRSINVKKNNINKVEEEVILSDINNALNGKNEGNIQKLVEKDRSNVAYNNIIDDDLKADNIEKKENNLQYKDSVDDLSNNNKDNYSNPNSDVQMMIKRELIKLDVKELDKYIVKGKDILNHNYSINYGEDALRYVYIIRDKYTALVEYFIGFNNEKKGIYNKKIFSDKMDNEWHFLKNYVIILETLKKLKK